MTKDDTDKYEKTICLWLNGFLDFRLDWVGEQNTFLRFNRHYTKR